METLTENKRLIGKEAVLQSVEYGGTITYGIRQTNVIFEDISCNRLSVQGLIKLINGAWKTNKREYELLHRILIDVADRYEEELSEL